MILPIIDVMQADTFIDESIRFFEKMIIGLPLEKYLSMSSIFSLDKIEGDLGKVLKLMNMNKLDNMGQSHDRFIVFGDCILSHPGKAIVTTVSNVDERYVEEEIQQGTMAKLVKYKQKFYEAGPLARAMVSKEPVVKSLHKVYKDSIMP